ncbi:MAG: hypothetical protein JSS66_16035 [Armatimonadetes bacterium]|nr:hypothetical protein [Armatimonadota bacterium]
MITPYDWQEAVGHRAQFIESRIAAGIPVVAVTCDEGIVAGTFKRQSRKLFEVYDRLMYSAIGQQSDIESLRVAAVDFAHREGYQRSEQDVTIQRVVTAISQPIKDAFANFQVAPLVAKAIFMEVGETAADDKFYIIDYDGDYTIDHGAGCLAGLHEIEAELETALTELKTGNRRPKDIAQRLEKILAKTIAAHSDDGEVMSGLVFEAALLARNRVGDRRFRLLTNGDE